MGWYSSPLKGSVRSNYLECNYDKLMLVMMKHMIEIIIIA